MDHDGDWGIASMVNVEVYSILGPVLGGVIAASAGLIASKLQHGWRREAEREDWWRRLGYLLERFENDLSLGNADDVRRKDWHANHFFTVEQAQEELSKHVMDAPVEVPKEIWNVVDETQRQVWLLSGKNEGNREFVEKAIELERATEPIVEWWEQNNDE